MSLKSFQIILPKDASYKSKDKRKRLIKLEIKIKKTTETWKTGFW